MEKAVSAGGKRKAVSAAAVGAGDKKFKSNTIGRKEKAREEEEAASSVMEVDEDEQDVFGSTKGGSVAPSDGGGKRRVSLVGAVSVKEESVDEAGEVIKESSAKEKEKETVTASGGGGRKKVSAQETHNKAVSTRCLLSGDERGRSSKGSATTGRRVDTKTDTLFLLFIRSLARSTSKPPPSRRCSSGTSPKSIPSLRNSGIGS